MRKYGKLLAMAGIAAVLMSGVGCGSQKKKADNYYSKSGPEYYAPRMINAEDAGAADLAYAKPTDENSAQANTDEYNVIKENSFMQVSVSPLSTFALDVDTASYTQFRDMRRRGISVENIPSGAIRTEEFLNYFDYDKEPTYSDGKFTVHSEIHPCPWNEEHGLLYLRVTANPVETGNKGNNFVFLIDTSGSMGSQKKITLAIEGFSLLTEQLTAKDKVSIVTYAGSADTLLEGCSGADHDKINRVLRSISTNGGTNGSGGIEAAYTCAVKNFIEGGNNRVILASDGDMNLGITSESGLVDLITEKKKLGVFLTTLGFGSGNYSDSNMEGLADAGNGNYFFIDSTVEAKRVLVDKMMQTTVTVAKDVKLQAEFNPEFVSEYRLLGYENRALAAKDFEDDTKDGGEVGAGACVSVLYELVYAAEGGEEPSLKYQTVQSKGNTAEILNVAIRYKEPDGETSAREDYPVEPKEEACSEDWYFAAGIAEITGLLHKSTYFPGVTFTSAKELIQQGSKKDSLRLELLELLP